MIPPPHPFQGIALVPGNIEFVEGLLVTGFDNRRRTCNADLSSQLVLAEGLFFEVKPCRRFTAVFEVYLT